MPAWEDVSPYTEERTRAHRFTWTNLLILLNLAGFVISGFLSNNNPGALASLEFDGPSAIGQLHVWQFLTYSFVQPTFIQSAFPKFIPWLILGIYVLYALGNELEADLGPRRYLSIYFACAAYGALAHAFVQYLVPAFAPGIVVGRAATLAAPVLGIAQTAAHRWPRRPVLFLYFLPMRLRTAFVLLATTWLAYAVWNEQGLAASIGSLFTAMAISTLEPRIDRSVERALLRRERDQFLEEVEVRRRTDQILEKITREGMSRLTRAERRTLRLASQILGRAKSPPHE